MSEDTEFEEEDEEVTAPLEPDATRRFSDAVVFSADWTVETILSQLRKGNIQLNPNFQRREAWSTGRKSKFIETVIVGLPAPQLVFAEVKDQRGRFIVLDGKQRLLTLLRFTESEEDRSAGFGLSSLEIRGDLSRRKYYHFCNNPDLNEDRNAFLNYPIRTVIIRNWPNNEFLHQVFLRLNTGSVKLSSQELRQAMAPGDFTTFADDFSANSLQIQSLLGRNTPDPRMRDVELLVRHIAFQGHLEIYRGRMKSFLDDVCEIENMRWRTQEYEIGEMSRRFEQAIATLTEILGARLARKPDSRSFNRAIFDTLSYFAANDGIREVMRTRAGAVAAAYEECVRNPEFLNAVESDTAGLPNTAARLRIWGEYLQQSIELNLNIPRSNEAGRLER